MRVSPPRVFGEAALASRPPAGSAGAQDAHRQTGFVLGAELDLLIRGLELEGAIADASSGAKYRTQAMAAAMGLWSRAWLTRLQTIHAVQWGNYAAALPLVRAAADYQAAQLELLRTAAAEWRAWLDAGGVAMQHAEHAMEYRLHPFRSGEVLFRHPVLGPVYRAATELSLSHFGATMLVTGSESTPERTMMTFADRDFHLGLAELIFGWLLQLCDAQLAAVTEVEAVFAPPDPERLATWRASAESMVGRTDRSRMTTIEREGEQRSLITGWRRRPGDAAKRVLL